MLNSKLKNLRQSGFTLVEVMIATGLASLLALAVGNLLVTSMQSQKSVAIGMDVSQIASSIQTLLANTDACYLAIGGGAYAPQAGVLPEPPGSANAAMTIYNPQGVADVTTARTVRYSACAWTGTASTDPNCRPTPELQITDIHFESKHIVAGPYTWNYRAEFKDVMKWPASWVSPPRVVSRQIVNGEAVVTLRKVKTFGGSPTFTRRFGMTLTVERDASSSGAWKVARCSGGGGEGITENLGWDDLSNCTDVVEGPRSPDPNADCAGLSIAADVDPLAAGCPSGKYVAQTSVEYIGMVSVTCMSHDKKGDSAYTQDAGPYNKTKIKCCNVPK